MQASPSRLQRCDVTAEADGPKDSRMVSPLPKLIIGWSKEDEWKGLVGPSSLGWALCGDTNTGRKMRRIANRFPLYSEKSSFLRVRGRRPKLWEIPRDFYHETTSRSKTRGFCSFSSFPWFLSLGIYRNSPPAKRQVTRQGRQVGWHINSPPRPPTAAPTHHRRH